MENNPRLSAGISQVIDCGQDSPVLTLKASSKYVDMNLPEFREYDEPYQYYQHAHWLLRDVNGWIYQETKHTSRKSVKWLINIVRSFINTDSHITWDRRDPLPSLIIYASFVKRIAVGILRRFRILKNESTN